MPAFLLGAADPVAVAQRLQIPGKQQQWLQQCGALRDWLKPTHRLRGHPIDLVDLPLSNRVSLRRRWPCRTLRPKQWKPAALVGALIQAPQTARDLIAAGWQPGPAIGEELRQRSAAQDVADETQLACFGAGSLALGLRPCC